MRSNEADTRYAETTKVIEQIFAAIGDAVITLRESWELRITEIEASCTKALTEQRIDQAKRVPKSRRQSRV